MTEQDERPTEERGGGPSDTIERVLQLAGSRPEAGPERMRRVRQSVDAAWRDSIRQRTRRRRQILGTLVVAAVATVVIAVALGRRMESAPPAMRSASSARLMAAIGAVKRTDDPRASIRVGDDVVAGAVVETGSGMLATFAWLDGGEVRMNEGTVVRFGGAREVDVDRGAIYLDSGPRSGSVIVRTPVGVVRDVGTRFEVGVIGAAWHVRVRDGLVRYEGAVLHQAGAGRELIVEPGRPIIERPSTTYGAEWDWVVRAAPPFRVEGQTLIAFLDWVAREGGRRVEFSSDELRRASSGTMLHGSIETLTVDEALDAILPTCGLSHRIESQRVIVSRGDVRRGAVR